MPCYKKQLILLFTSLCLFLDAIYTLKPGLHDLFWKCCFFPHLLNGIFDVSFLLHAHSYSRLLGSSHHWAFTLDTITVRVGQLPCIGKWLSVFADGDILKNICEYIGKHLLSSQGIKLGRHLKSVSQLMTTFFLWELTLPTYQGNSASGSLFV